jgi:hypothetical protein
MSKESEENEKEEEWGGVRRLLDRRKWEEE